MKETAMQVPMKHGVAIAALAGPLFMIRTDEDWVVLDPKDKRRLLTADPMQASHLGRAVAEGCALALRGGGFEAELVRVIPVAIEKGN